MNMKLQYYYCVNISILYIMYIIEKNNLELNSFGLKIRIRDAKRYILSFSF